MVSRRVSFALSLCMVLLLFTACSPEAVVQKGTYAGQANVTYELIENFTIDVPPIPPATSSSKHLLCKIVLELTDETLAVEFDTKQHRINDLVISIIRTKSRAELESTSATEMLSTEITAAINEAFNTTGVDKIYFTTYYIG